MLLLERKLELLLLERKLEFAQNHHPSLNLASKKTDICLFLLLSTITFIIIYVCGVYKIGVDRKKIKKYTKIGLKFSVNLQLGTTEYHLFHTKFLAGSELPKRPMCTRLTRLTLTLKVT